VPAYWPGGVRHGGGASLICGFCMERGKAGVDTVDVHRGWCAAARGSAPGGGNREALSTVAAPADGPARSSGEAPVMGVELVNTNAGGGLVSDGGLADCGAVRVMEVVWPSGIALRGEVSNHYALRPLTAVRGERHRKRRAVSASGVVREDGCKYLSLTRRNPFQSTSKPRSAPHLGMNLGDTRLLPRWCPAYRQHEPGQGSRMERVKVSSRNCRQGWRREGELQAAETVRG